MHILTQGLQQYLQESLFFFPMIHFTPMFFNSFCNRPPTLQLNINILPLNSTNTLITTLGSILSNDFITSLFRLISISLLTLVSDLSNSLTSTLLLPDDEFGPKSSILIFFISLPTPFWVGTTTFLFLPYVHGHSPSSPSN